MKQFEPSDKSKGDKESNDRLAEPVDSEQPPRLPFPVVGLGASAGGLEAFSEFFGAMQPDSGMAFVVILHLPPERDSLLADILSKRTEMAVSQVEEGVPVEVNHVYVIRPGHTITLRDGKLHLEEPVDKPGHRHVVDDFFRSLAAEQRERAICVVMSGMGSNGSAGAQSVKAVGGLCIAQEPESAKFPAMPRNLIDSGMADFILRPADIPELLIRYATHPYTKETGSATTVAQRERQAVNEILAVMRARMRQDFTGYKKPTLVRRIQRRMGLNQITKMEDYARLLRQTPGEVTALADDLMIHVTGFFRDDDSWETLKTRVIAPLVAEREADAPIRAWVTACSSGEEAYTLAMLLTEAAQAAGKHFDIKIFATDTAERSLAHARSGLFPASIESEITSQRLERFFEKDDSAYRVKKELREQVVFAPQNVLQDPPFSRLDICTCRNLLIYLEPDIQRRVLSILHFGLREGGVLFLGTSETVSNAEGLFEPIDKKRRIFRRVGPTRHGTIEFPLPGMLSGDAERAEVRSPLRASISQLTTRALLDRYTPPAIVIDRQQRIVYFHGDTDRYLDQPKGEPTRELMSLVREPMRGAVRTAVQRALSQNAVATVADGVMETEKGRRRVEVRAAPLEQKGEAATHFLISFDDRPEPTPTVPSEADKGVSDRHELEEELRRAREELQSMIEELQTSNEEMRASNEEVTSVNEELQSTNEELETSKEELQSLNEELTTVNAQLQAKMEELEGMTNDLASLLSSTDIGVVFLDTQFRIRRFTPAMKDLIELIPSDMGRPLSDMARKFDDPDLLKDVQLVLERLVPSEKEVTSASNRVYLRRALPYRTMDNRIDGVVLTFVDISSRKQADEELRKSEERYRLIVESVKEYAIFMLDKEGRFEMWTSSAERMFGYSASEVMGKSWSVTFTPEDRKNGEAEKRLKMAREHGSESEERWSVRKDGSLFWISGALSALTDREGKIRGFVKVLRDNTDKKQFEDRLKESKKAAEIANEAKDQFLANVSHELRTPLSAMLLWANMLQEGGPVATENLREGIDVIKKSAEAQKELIEDLLDTSRIAAGKLRLDLKETELVPVVHSAVEGVRPAAGAKELTVTEELDDGVGVVRADPHRIQQVVLNLLSNAVKFTPAGGRIVVGMRRKEDQVEIWVTDTGDGIEKEFMPHIFERFGRADSSTTRSKSGLGLGLTISKQLVELHNGTISVRSDGKGKGSTFMVRLPLAKLAGTADDLEQRPSIKILGSLKGIRILLVEDEPTTREALFAALRVAGAEVSSSDSAANALKTFGHWRPDLIVSDIGMPGMDGYELMGKIRKLEDRENGNRVPAIALSAFTTEKDSRKAMESGFQLHLGKPIEPVKLISEILALKAKGR